MLQTADLRKVKIGDEVCYSSPHGHLSIQTVQSITRTGQVTLSNGARFMANGVAIGSSPSKWRSSLVYDLASGRDEIAARLVRQTKLDTIVRAQKIIRAASAPDAALLLDEKERTKAINELLNAVDVLRSIDKM